MGQRVVQPIVGRRVEQVLNALDAALRPRAERRRGAGEDRRSERRRGGHPPGSPEAYSDDPKGPTHSA